MNDYNLKYPVGEFVKPKSISAKDISEWIEIINSFYETLNSEVETLSKEEWQWHYRSGGWTIQQIVHHCADSHMNAFIRFKLTLTENDPVIKEYQENLWAELSDSCDATIDWSLSIIYGLHKRWVYLLNRISPDDFKRVFFHPESREFIKLEESLAHYAWHCKHHLEHIRSAKKYKA